MHPPDVNADPMRCGKCGAVLQIICPTHGTEATVVHRHDLPTNLVKHAPTNRAPHGSRREAILQLAEARGVITVQEIVDAEGITRQNAYVVLSKLTALGLLERASEGKYRLPTGAVDAVA